MIVCTICGASDDYGYCICSPPVPKSLKQLMREAEFVPMTACHRMRQRIDFAYGNLACTTNHHVPKSLVIEFALRPFFDGLDRLVGRE